MAHGRTQAPTRRRRLTKTGKYCHRCGVRVHRRAAVCPACRVRQGRAGPPPRYAGVWARLGALVVDRLVLAFSTLLSAGLLVAVQEEFGLTLAPPEQLAAVSWLGAMLFGGWLYHAGLEAGTMQATLGQSLLGLRVTDTQGRPISFRRASRRHLGRILATLSAGLGHLMPAWSPKQQALHDVVAGTAVVRSGPDRGGRRLPAAAQEPQGVTQRERTEATA